MTGKCRYSSPCPSTLGGQTRLGLSRFLGFLLQKPAAHGGQGRTGRRQQLGTLMLCRALSFSQLQQPPAMDWVGVSVMPPSKPAGVSSSGLGLTAVISPTALPLHSKWQPISILDTKTGSRWEKAYNTILSKNSRMDNEVFVRCEHNYIKSPSPSKAWEALVLLSDGPEFQFLSLATSLCEPGPASQPQDSNGSETGGKIN